MPSYLNSSRIRKPGSAPPLRRHSTTAFSAAQRSKPSIQRTHSLAEALKDKDDHDDEGPRLSRTGATLTVIQDGNITDLPSAMRHATETMYCSIPERAGMNSTRISEVLNYQKRTPSLVSLAHIHSLLATTSKTERQINASIANGTIRKIKVIGRGNDISGVSESLILTSSLETLLQQSDISQAIAEDFLDLLQEHPRAILLPAGLPSSHLTALTRAGFLVSASAYLNSSHSQQITRSAIVSTAAISRASSGSYGAVGGEAAFENLGGTGGAKRSDVAQSSTASSGPQLMLSVPGIGSYIRLLAAGRAHLLDILARSPYHEVPLYLLKERWDGAVDGDSSVSQARQVRGVFSEIMPAKTKKWRKLWGLRFEWALEECLGAGLVEVFETGSVGLGVRALGR